MATLMPPHFNAVPGQRDWLPALGCRARATVKADSVFPSWWSCRTFLRRAGPLCPATWRRGILQVNLPFLFVSLLFMVAPFPKGLCEARPSADLALVPDFCLAFLLQARPKVRQALAWFLLRELNQLKGKINTWPVIKMVQQSMYVEATIHPLGESSA